jgi:two-component system sensor histidine kinase TctE
LRNLKQAISERSSADLRPVDEAGVPAEVLPLVQAINGLLDRLRVEIESQKRFVANAAHQIRTPVAGLKTYVGFAQRLAHSEELKKVLSQVDEGTDRITHLTNRLLSLARAEPNNMRARNYNVADLNVVVSSALSKLVSLAIGKNIELAFEASSTPAMISGQVESLEELVLNIVENALIYTQNGGIVSVRVGTGDAVVLTVEDNGPGIPREERQQVFERFYRVLGTEASGSGLGLAIVKEIATAHDACVAISDGKDGRGTLVSVRLPVVAPSLR